MSKDSFKELFDQARQHPAYWEQLCECKQWEISRLTAELEEARDQLNRKRCSAHEATDYERAIAVWKYRAESAEQDVAKWQEQHYRLLNTICEWKEKCDAAEAELSRYRQGVEVEGILVRNPWGVQFSEDIQTKWGWNNNQRVRVLVMPVEG